MYPIGRRSAVKGKAQTPEMTSETETQFLLDPESCTHCNECLDICPHDAIELTADDIYIDPDACDGCEDCVLVCPTTAIQLGGTEFVPRPRRRPGAAKGEDNVVSLDDARPGRRVAGGPSRTAAATPWHLTDVGIGLLLLLALALAQRALQLPLRLRDISLTYMHIILAAWMLFFYATIVAALTALANRRGAVLEDFGVCRFRWPKAIGYALGALVSVYALTAVYAFAASTTGFENTTRTEAQMLRWFGPGPSGFLLALVVAVIVAPVVEELFFRGFVHKALRERIGVVGAIVASSLIFALYHANLWLIIPVMFLGMALAWLFETQQSLGPPILFHALYNFLAIIQIYFFAGR